MTGEEQRDLIERIVNAAVDETGGTPGLMVAEYVLIAAVTGWDGEGETITQVVIVPTDGSESRILGLVDHAQTRMRADILEA